MTVIPKTNQHPLSLFCLYFSLKSRWSYQCLNLQEMAMNSRLKRFIKKGSWIKLFEVEVPEQEAVHETLYVDEVAFVSEPLYG